MNVPFAEFLAAGGAFQGYTYAYPHKTAYRRLVPARDLESVWASEDKSALFLYAHVPFCEMRCGFCNLFTTTHPGANRVNNYLDAFERQAVTVAGALGNSARYARLAIGGGTPTFLDLNELARLFGILNGNFPGAAAIAAKAIEASPATVDHEKVAFLKSQGITRVSLGVQSFLESETHALGRAQRAQDIRNALDRLTGAKFACVNVDLIYGIPGQTVSSWRSSLEQAVEYGLQEIYLYPLYVRPLTHLGRLGIEPDDTRLELYRTGRELLQERGYRQISMRLFRHASYVPPEGPVYCCQEDGMVGLGAGARSYTAALHYSSEYAVGRAGVLNVLADFCGRTHEQFSRADYGCELDLTEQKRRYLLKSLLRVDGLDGAAYEGFFDTRIEDDFPQLSGLFEAGLMWQSGNRWILNERGLELSDVIGPWLCSPAVREKMNDYVLT